MVHGIRLRGGKAEWYRNRYVGSTVATAPSASPISRAATGTTGARPEHQRRRLRRHDVGDGRGRACPVELTYELDTVGRNDFYGTLPGAFTAHPKVDPATGEMHAMVYAWASGSTTSSTSWSEATAGCAHARHPAARA